MRRKGIKNPLWKINGGVIMLVYLALTLVNQSGKKRKMGERGARVKKQCSVLFIPMKMEIRS